MNRRLLRRISDPSMREEDRARLAARAAATG